MRKTIAEKVVSLLAAVALCFAVAAVALITAPESAFAARAKITAVSDEFNSDALSGLWVASSAENAGVKDYGGAIMMRESDYAHAVNWMGYERKADGKDGIKSSYSLEFVLTRECESGGAWASCYLGLETPDLRMNTITPNSDGSRGYSLVMNDGSAILYTANNTVQTGSVNLGLTHDGTRYAIKLDVAVNSDGGDVITLYSVKAPDDLNNVDYGAAKGTIQGNAATGDLDLRGYFGFGSNLGKTEKMTVSKIKLTEGQNVWQPQNDLKTLDIDHIYGSQPADETKEFRCWNPSKDAYADKYTNAPVGVLNVKQGASVYSAQEIQTDSSLISLLEINFKMNVLEGGDGCKVVFGKTETAATEITFTKQDGDLIAALGENKLNLGELSGNQKYKLAVKSDGDVIIYVNDKHSGVLGGAASFSGKVGFAAAENADFEIDDVNVTYYAGRSSQESDMSIDFSIKRPNGNTYLDADEWYTAGNALLTKYNEISFVNANQDAVFSTKKAYADYVFKFDLFDIGQGVGGCNWIGISFAKPEYSDNFANAPTIMFAPRGGSELYTNLEPISGATFAGGGNIRSSHNIFTEMGAQSTHKKLNVVLEVNNRTVKLYFKYDDEPESMLASPKAVIQDIDTYGYVGINCNYGGNFAVGNVSVRSLNVDRGYIADYGDKIAESNRVSGDSSLGL